MHGAGASGRLGRRRAPLHHCCLSLLDEIFKGRAYTLEIFSARSRGERATNMAKIRFSDEPVWEHNGHRSSWFHSALDRASIYSRIVQANAGVGGAAVAHADLVYR